MDERKLIEDDEGETEEQRERYRELLEELRTVMPGTQVLFAFLLTAVFSQRFPKLDDLGKRSFAAALLLAALAAVTLMGPAAFHRMSKPGKRPERLVVSIKLQIIGMALLLTAMAVVMFVVARLIFDDTVIGVMFGGATAAAGIGIWYVLPRVAHLNRED
jgi:MFS family permease